VTVTVTDRERPREPRRPDEPAAGPLHGAP